MAFLNTDMTQNHKIMHKQKKFTNSCFTSNFFGNICPGPKVKPHSHLAKYFSDCNVYDRGN